MFRVINQIINVKFKIPDLGSCHRDICECDRIFANDLSDSIDNWLDEYSHDAGFDTATCVGNGRLRGVKKCCQNQGQTSNWVMYNQNRNECCNDGNIAPVGEC